MKRIYLSGPLFSRGEIAWGGRVKSFLEERLKDIEVIWPHELVPCTANKEQIFLANIRALDEAEIMVAILDGAQVDDGTAWEIGYFFSKGRRLLGLRTDLRRAGETDSSIINLMIECSCLKIVGSLDALGEELQRLCH